MAWSRRFATAVLLAVLAGGPGCAREAGRGPGDGGLNADAGPVRCGPGDDRDSDGIGDRDEGEDDPDRDGVPSAEDDDSDGDGISDAIEAGDALCATPPVDTERDGTPDFLDLDSDDDAIADATEGEGDHDRDGTPDRLDRDSDGDGAPDRLEAGDLDFATAPATCALGAAPRPDYLRADSDGDGLGDGEEHDEGTSPCDRDSDGDGDEDLVESAYARVACGDGEGCGCALDPSCRVPPIPAIVPLPWGATAERDVTFETAVRSADVFFLVDTTESMGATLARVQETIAAPDGLIAGLVRAIPDAWVGGGELGDFPFGAYGGSGDEPLRVAISMSPPAQAESVRAAFAAMVAEGGGDLPEAHVEALYRLIGEEGASWSYRRGDGALSSYSLPRYSGDCREASWGAACFRDAALPVIVLFTDICARNGPSGESPGCAGYEGVEPPPVAWDAMTAALRERGARVIGINTASASCATASAPSGYEPCFFLRRTAEATGAVDAEGRPLVSDLPVTTERAEFVATLTAALETLATRVPLDVETAVRDDPSDPQRVDARVFVGTRRPACAAGATTCWEAPEGVTHEGAVGGYDDARFLQVWPRARVTYRVSFQNETRAGGVRSEVHGARIELRAGGSAILDVAEVFVVVPAHDPE